MRFFNRVRLRVRPDGFEIGGKTGNIYGWKRRQTRY
jgi:hypothetical protein